LTQRNVTTFPVGDRNSLWFWPQTVHPLRVIWQFSIISFCRISPSFLVKNIFYRMLGIKVGKDAAIGLMVMMDTFYPEQIEIGNNVIIGYNSTLLGHEFLISEYRIGKIIIGDNVLIGANSTVLPGVTIGEGAVISAMSLVNRDIPPHSFFGGVPVREIKKDA
jgi:acetyltransferase-like isoleucine patch superfamily enzyme